jgi:hypothetical protein
MNGLPKSDMFVFMIMDNVSTFSLKLIDFDSGSCNVPSAGLLLPFADPKSQMSPSVCAAIPFRIGVASGGSLPLGSVPSSHIWHGSIKETEFQARLTYTKKNVSGKMLP